MTIDYEDIKSDWLSVNDGASVEFVIKKDATKVMKTSSKTGNPYPSYEFQVESNGSLLKWSALLGTYRVMVKDAGSPKSLVGTGWKWSKSGDEYADTVVKGGVK